MATPFSQMSQSERSKYRYEVSTRRMMRTGAFAKLAEAEKVADAQGQYFVLEVLHADGTWGTVAGSLSGPVVRADKAKDLIPIAIQYAKRSLGIKYRIRRNDGTRAVHRIAARRLKDGRVECYSWSS